MPFRRHELAPSTADRLNLLANQHKTRTRASLNDANHSLEFVMARFFNALLGWDLVDLNAEQSNFPAADLGDRPRRIAMQITNEYSVQKISGTAEKARAHRLGETFDLLIIFFLLPRKPSLPKKFVQPEGGPKIETWDLADLLQQMNNLPDVNVLAAAARILEEETGTIGSLGSLLYTLPPRPAGFVGREGDLEILRALDPAAGAVLTGLRGMPGIGKTALALVLAHEWAPRFPDAQLFLDARGTQPDPPAAQALMEQVIRTFHPDAAPLPDDPDALAARYRQVLGGKKVLLLLDNARDAVQARPLIPPAGCAFIVTSRLSILLGTVRPHDVGRLPDTEAAALLREFHPDLTDAHAAALVKLCAGLPLALRLAGSHLALDGPAPDVSGYLRKLGGGRLAHLDAEAAEAGEITISETLRLSTAQLPSDERAAWEKLGVFTASFEARAAETIAGAGEEMLGRFVRRSLLEREGGDRYRLHDLAADYARAQLGSDALPTLHRTHAAHYTAVGDETQGIYMKGDAVGGLALFDRERAQIEAAHTWLAACGDEAAARQVLALVGAVVYTGDLRFHPHQRIAWLESQLRAARLVCDRQAEGTALGNLGSAHFTLGGAGEALEFYEQWLVIAREIGDRRGEGNALLNSAVALHTLGNRPEAIARAEAALAIYEAVESPTAAKVRAALAKWRGEG